MDRRHLVVVVERGADRSHLIALAHEPVRSQAISVVERVIDLRQPVVAVAILRKSTGVVVDRWNPANVPRQVSGSCRRPERTQEIGSHRVYRYVEFRQSRFGSGLPGLRRLRRLIRNPNREPLMLVSREPEQLVFDNWAACREAIIVVSDLLLDWGRKRISGAEELVAIVVIGGAMDLIGSGLQRQIDAATRITA